ncbi:MAG: FIST N-terminal domain-containing protein [Campylobacterota bacterium]|nr:FIST N-terminal domain-containing protein [Campylobacterota bacterium]
MTIDKLHFEKSSWILEDKGECRADAVDIVFVFGDIDVLQAYNHSALLKQKYPNAHIVGASTAGNILDNTLSEYGAVATAVSFDKGHISVNSVHALRGESLIESSKALVEGLPQDGLRHIFVLADSLKTNGSELTKGVNSISEVSVTGGLAGDDMRFDHTLVFIDGPAEEMAAVAIGFYGESLHVRIGCKAGWDEFGAERVVTKSEGNIVYEIDDKPALELYENYLGEYIKDLPASGLLFPLNIKEHDSDNEVIRVMMGINEDRSIVFAGDIPQRSIVRLMRTNIENLIDGASLAANAITPHNTKRSLALTVSCSGRRSVLKQLVDEEIEVIQEILGDQTQLVGFYSYGEIAPFSDDLLDCKLHNQTMTLTVIYED